MKLSILGEKIYNRFINGWYKCNLGVESIQGSYIFGFDFIN